MAQRIQIFNGARGKGKTKGKKKRPAANLGGLSFMFNGRGGKVSSKKTKGKKKSKGNPSHQYRASSRRKGHKNSGRRSGRRNGMREGRAGFGGLAETVIAGGITAVLPGIILSNFLPQYNSGLMGYVGDVVIGGGLSWLAGRFVSKGAFNGGITGTVAAIAIRASQDLSAAPHLAVSADVRDAQAAKAAAPGVSGARRMGTTVSYPFLVPQPGFGAQPAAALVPAAAAAQPAMGRTMDRRRRY